ncbi:MAG: protease HtpX [Elusimicrobia bacterium RIFCSPLOWO2_01_FULL_59_12]|nr:MAG: protease HtpX [Elusimicrobia bacterium RIFCSPLOWO2_01_FULL_59_12]
MKNWRAKVNSLKTFLLLTGLMALFVFIGRQIGGQAGMVYAFGFACVMNFVSYWFSDKIVLMMFGAKEASREQAPELYEIVEDLARKANIPMPRIYLIQSPAPNAFATGRNPKHAAIAATTGILERLDAKELEGVLGHELSHVFNRDILISTIAATVAGAIMMLANMARWGMMFGGYGGRDRENRGGLELLAVAILAPLAAALIQMAISRSREYEADRSGAALTGKPLALASALQKIAVETNRARVPLSTNPATAHLFIMNPLRGEGLFSLFSTHPPTSERIKRLEAMDLNRATLNAPRVVY